MKLVLSILLGILAGTALGLAFSPPAKAQMWVETVTYTDSNGVMHLCTITYTNGGRNRFVNCT